jgi:hypothetical protein
VAATTRKKKDAEPAVEEAPASLIPGLEPAAPKAYTVLARRYRSRTFDEVVGQEAISRTLQNAILTGRTAHAYLFYPDAKSITRDGMWMDITTSMEREYEQRAPTVILMSAWAERLQLHEAIAITIDQKKPFGPDRKYAMVCVDPADAANTREGIVTTGYELTLALLGQQIHHHKDLLCADGKIHRPANGRNRIGFTGMPIGEVTLLGDLKGA